MVILVALSVAFQVAAFVSSLMMPGMLLRSGISAGYLLIFSIFITTAAVLSMFVIYFFRLRKFLKETGQNAYRMTILNIGRRATLSVLFIAGALYIAGLHQAFSLHSWQMGGLSGYAGLSPAGALIFLAAVMSLCTGAFVLFIYRRSAYSLRQYWVFFILGYLTMIGYAVVIPGQSLAWNTSILTRTQLLSWDYGFLGWIIILLTVLALVYTIGSVLFLRLRELFNQIGKAKGLSLVYLKLGYICLVLAGLIIVFPQVLDMF